MKRILRVVITGGPCAGKTTALKDIKKRLEVNGYEVLTSHEIATMIITSGAIPKPSEKGNVSLHTFQKIILDMTIAQENALLELASDIDSEKVAIIYDRGILDNRAYIPHSEFQGLIDEKNITVEQILNRYDIILHLVSTALDKPEEYSKNNQARLESLEEAIQVELATQNAWPESNNKFIFYNDCDFEEKLRRVMKTLLEYTNKEEKHRLILPKEISTKEKPKIYQKVLQS